MDLNQTRYISITLTEPEWEGLRALQPDPCRWLKEQVHQLLEENGRQVESRPSVPAPRPVQGQLA
jgi:hypothetical protein